MFEIIKRDGLARIGKFETRHGTIETPALLPVINPKICTVTPRELYDEFGFGALITNSYIIKNNPELKEKAQSQGLHEMLDFPGVIMTDSGTFQSHMYGEVEVTNEEMVEFQKSIGTDIGTVLDIFTEPYWSEEKTAASIEVTLERTQKACEIKGDMLINGVAQGSIYTDLREDCARKMASMDIDVHPIGGVVPLMEQYRYSELVDVVLSSKKGLNPNRPVHLFGAGHPMLFALAALMGCDLFDSASYAKFARDDRLMFIDGTFRLAEMQSLDCNCPACRGHTLESLRKLNNKDRTKTIARHNLYQIKGEMAMVKRYIREGRLWELAEMRCRAHPALLDALRKLEDYQDFLELYDPISRDGAMFYTGTETRGRPVFLRYYYRLMDRYVPPTDKAVFFVDEGSKPYSRAFASEFDKARKAGYTPVVVSPFGPVPAELDEMYPLAQSLFPKIDDYDTTDASAELTAEFLAEKFNEAISFNDLPEDGNEEYDADLLRAKAVSRYQFGIEATDALFRGKIELVVSRKTAKIRNVISDGEHVLSMRAGDGLYTLRKEGADRIVAAVPAPHMRVTVMDDAVPFVSEGRNVFCQFVLSCDETLRPMEEVMVVDKDDKVIATGRAMLVAEEIRSFKKGVAVKIRSGSGDEA
ncbi:MAG: tRNA guanosine(15) transglycosylase TgtA [Candidatus Methanoplasma sp.]|jgi:7-cyano-7-deazaguanine tRNA-ribosyltransferase|nr:tRNA guanosine(15) transglycosylase TgtA [Candidatus Methanoplasma sp.]